MSFFFFRLFCFPKARAGRNVAWEPETDGWRCCRIPEMAMGWANELMQNETLFLILDGAMILLAVMLLTLFHPALLFPFMGKVGEEKEQIMAERAEQREMREVL